jgi:hypothetical protein
LGFEVLIDRMGYISSQSELGNGAGVERFFAGREALIEQEKQQRSGMAT